MFGYIISKKFGESKVWNYASITIFEEVGFDLKLYRGKVFNEEVIDIVKNITVGDQVQFEVKRITRGTRNYTEFTFIAPENFQTCNKCAKISHDSECTGEHNAERLEGEFKIIDLQEMDLFNKLVLKHGKTQFTFIQWNNSPFTDKFAFGDNVMVCGWRNENRITKLRMLHKVPNNA